tara:strand:- start:3635 stop:7624 length:3990 start_codon:yes stop_codon:yes gene_type:complete
MVKEKKAQAVKANKLTIYDKDKKKYYKLYKKVGNKLVIDPAIKKNIEKKIDRYRIPKDFFLDKEQRKLLPLYSSSGSISKSVKKIAKDNVKRIKMNNKQSLNITDLNSIGVLSRAEGKKAKGVLRDGGLILEAPKEKFEEVSSGDKDYTGKTHENSVPNNSIVVEKIYNVEIPFLEEDEEQSAVVDQLLEDQMSNFVYQIRYAYFRDFNYNQRTAPIKKVMLRFIDKGFEDFRYFPIDKLYNLSRDLKEYETKATNPNSWGSDAEAYKYSSAISLETLDMSWFKISIIGSANLLGGANNAKVSSKYWYCDQPITKWNCCLEGAIRRFLNMKQQYLSLRKIMDEKHNIEKGDFVSFDKLCLYEDEFNININVYEDTPHYNNDNCIRKSTRIYEKTLRVLYKDEHFSLIKKEKLKINELSTTEQRKFGVYKKPMKSIIATLDNKEKKKLKELLVVFDIETIFDRNDRHYLKSYGVSWVVWDINDKFEYDPKKHLNPPYTYYEKGQGCLRKFVKFLLKPPKDCKYKPFGFNNSRFDNFALCGEARNLGVLTNVFMCDGSILNFSIEGCANSWDTSRFLVGQSLDSACKSYNTNPKKEKDLINHYEVQCYFERYGWKGLMELLNTKEDLVIYNKLDCLCLLDLSIKMRQSYLDLFGEDCFQYLTISSMGYKIQTKLWEGNGDKKKAIYKMDCDKKIKAKMIQALQPKFNIVKPKDYKDDFWFRASLTAGRTQSFYGKLDLQIPLAMGDIKSLYPTCMGNYGGNDCPYPYGDYRWVKQEEKGKLGIYLVNIIHQRAKWKSDKVLDAMDRIRNETGEDLYREFAPNIIARREKDKPLDWFFKDKIENVCLTSVDIDVIRWATEDENCIEVLSGIVWDESNTELFKDFLDPPKKEKTKQDKLKVFRKNYINENYTKEQIKNKEVDEKKVIKFMNDKHGEDYNEAKREGSKGASNCLSGKLLECIHQDTTKRMSVKAFIDMENDESIKEMEIQEFGGGLSFIIGKKSKEDVFNDMKNNSKKPSYLGMFVYSYARKLMYQKLLSKYLCLYMDTDSACMPLFEWDRLNNENGFEFVENGEYGCIEEEVCKLEKCDSCLSRDTRLEVSGCPKEEIEFRTNNLMVDGVRCKDCSCIPANRLIAISPKNYAVLNDKCEYMSKRKFKGVRKTDFFKPLESFGEVSFNEEDGKINKKCEAVEVIRSKTQDEIRSIRETNCCVNCVKDVLDKKGKCKDCEERSKDLIPAYSTKMFELLCKGKKIAVFCSMINRIKYQLGVYKEWEYSDKTKYTPTIEEFTHILNSNSEDKNDTQLVYNKELNEFQVPRELNAVFKLKQTYLIKII